ncbi:hypothetical protein FA13DRAFT_1791834 [Coprinellus micaceus]|uniref:Transposase domain-containing protein n=1 Tax=Coprinellus micaceus TaxID=71717 RepID=A0A4Y7TB18_COPMI|nr:hypothetical protein FA13DRAFT_1791834 [Coprinellus micaceus]
MKLVTVSCPGCSAKVPRKYYLEHLQRSEQDACKVVLQSLDADLSSSDSDSEIQVSRKHRNMPHRPPPSTRAGPVNPPSDSPVQPVDEDVEMSLVVDAAGDHFGDYEDYMEDKQAGPNMDGQQHDPSEGDSYDSDNELPDYYLGSDELEVERPNAPSDPELSQELEDGEVAQEGCEPGPAPASLNQQPSRDTDYPSPYIISYGGSAGKPIRRDLPSDQQYEHSLPKAASSDYFPFSSRIDWDIARWAKLHSHLSASAVSNLLSIDGVVAKLGLSFKNSVELNKIIDTRIPQGRPVFQKSSFELEGEIFEIYHRDIGACIRSLFSDPEFAPYLKYAPEQHYTDESCSVRLYHDIHTGEWWSSTQKAVDRLKEGGTVIPIILSSDKTQLTLFRNKSAYPLYMTIGNIPKEIRRRPSYRAYVLLAYLPTSRLSHIPNKAARRRCLLNVYHSCLTKILSPLVETGKEGMEVVNGEGVAYRGHPIYACFIGDYPEQIQTTCTITGDCPGCPAPHDTLGEFNKDDANNAWRPLNRVLDALDAVDEDPIGYRDLAEELRVKPIIEPFWKELPLAHVYRSITPDVLHQLYQGVVKHLISWLKEACGASEIDARCRRLPPNHNIHHFVKGITSLSRVSGKEHAAMCQILLGLILEIRLPDGISNLPLLRAVRAILDFVFLAQYPVHTSHTLRLLEDALERFHSNKHVFVNLGIRDHFNIPKLHFASHYVRLIKLFGTTDNFNTEYTERLHIDLAKDAYEATNHKD